MSQSHTSSCSSKLLNRVFCALSSPAYSPSVTNMCSPGENSTSNHLSNQPISTRLRFPLQLLSYIHIYLTAPSVGAKRRARIEIPTSSHDFTVYTLRYKKRSKKRLCWFNTRATSHSVLDGHRGLDDQCCPNTAPFILEIQRATPQLVPVSVPRTDVPVCMTHGPRVGCLVGLAERGRMDHC